MLRHPVGTAAAAAGATGIVTPAPITTVLNVVEPDGVARRRGQAVAATATSAAATAHHDCFGLIAIRTGIVPGAGYNLMIALRCGDGCRDGTGRAGGVYVVAVEINVPAYDLMAVAGSVRCKSKRSADLLIIAWGGDGDVYRGRGQGKTKTGRQQGKILHRLDF